MGECFFLVGSLSEHLEKPISVKQKQKNNNKNQQLSNKFSLYVRNINLKSVRNVNLTLKNQKQYDSKCFISIWEQNPIVT